MLNQRIPQIFTLILFWKKRKVERRKKHLLYGKMLFRDRDRIQTCNRLIRSQLLYSVELRGQSLKTGLEEVTTTGFKPVTG